ncbi:MAG: TerB family tellurite resistance protein [Gallionella sp.]
MLNIFKKILGDSTPTISKRKEPDIALALTALMVQVMQQDDHLNAAEYDAIMQGIQSRFSLSENAAKQQIKLAIQASDQANDLHQFTAPLIKTYSAQERIDIIQQLWLVAMADKHIDPYEEALIRKVAELIGVHHHQFIDAKIQARENSQ